MKPKVNNQCQNLYRINAEKTVQGIIEKIPEKFLSGLEEISLFDRGKAHYPICRYLPEDKLERSRIEIYMENKILHKIPLFSTLALNIYLLLAINKHIDRYLKSKTEDKEISSIDPNRINYGWMYFSPWNPLFFIIKILHLIIANTRTFRNVFKRWVENLDNM